MPVFSRDGEVEWFSLNGTRQNPLFTNERGEKLFMGDASFNKGGVAARNLKAGSATLTGGADESVSFDRPMKSEPEVVVTPQSDNAVNVSLKDQTGFTVSSPATTDVTVSWMAFNDDRA